MAKGHGATPLSRDHRRALKSWYQVPGKCGPEEIFGYSRRTIERWIAGDGVTNGVHPQVVAELDRRLGHTPIDGDDGPRPATATRASQEDPRAELDRLFREGCALHYEQFKPIAALARLSQFVFHRDIAVLPLGLLLDRTAVTLGIARQSRSADAGFFASCADQCLGRLAATTLSGDAGPLEASICALAWELVAVTGQRGHAAHALEMLAIVDRVLRERRLVPLLADGRAGPMLRMDHWVRVAVSHDVNEAFAAAPAFDQAAFARVRPALYVGAERSNAAVSRLAGELRFAKAFPATRDVAKATFDTEVLPPLSALTRSLSSEARGGPRRPDAARRNLITPSSTLGAAFEGIVVAVEFRDRDADEVIELAVDAAWHVHRRSEGAVMLHHDNPQMRSAADQVAAAAERVRPGAASLFTFLKSFEPWGAALLYRRALRLLSYVDPRCASLNVPGEPAASPAPRRR